MRDIRGDLQERLTFIEQQIDTENARFQTLIAQLKSAQECRLESLKIQLQAVNRHIELATWQDNLRLTVARALALTAAVEMALPRRQE